MSVEMSAYNREPENPETFEKHYVQNHLPLIDDESRTADSQRDEAHRG